MVHVPRCRWRIENVFKYLGDHGIGWLSADDNVVGDPLRRRPWAGSGRPRPR